MKFIRRLWIVILALMLTVFLPCAFAGEEDPLRYVRLSEAVYSFEYQPTANGEYSICVFSVENEAVSCTAEVWENGELVMNGSGKGTVCTARLSAQSEYTISVRGSGKAAIEVARCTRSRCYTDALEILENERKSKMIARSGDAHWYRFTAENDAFTLLTCRAEDRGLNLGALLMDDSGNLISEFDTLPGGACILRAKTDAGHDYYVRVHSPEGSMGYYSIDVNSDEQSQLINAPIFNEKQFELSRNHTLDLREYLSGAVYLFTSSEPDVCAVSAEGVVTGLREGTAVITAYGFSSQTECTIEVINVPIESIDILSEKVQLAAGDDADVPIIVQPENASSDLLIFTIEDADIAAVSTSGVITGLRAGKTVLHAANARGTISDSVEVVVEEAPARYRALLIGEENYPEQINEKRPGTANSISVLSHMLESMQPGGERFITNAYTDLSKPELIRAIRENFARTGEKDVSLIYLSCHGEYNDGICELQLSDGGTITARQLESELRAIPGRIVLLLDCCGGGGAIGATSDPALFAQKMKDAFAGNSFGSSKYVVLCSTTLNRESYRIALNADDAIKATVFVRALCDALGWDYDTDERSVMQADYDMDMSVSIAELYDYVAERVDTYMQKVSADTDCMYVQEVCISAQGVPLKIFTRS